MGYINGESSKELFRVYQSDPPCGQGSDVTIDDFLEFLEKKSVSFLPILC